jgi:hypothetical protein
MPNGPWFQPWAGASRPRRHGSATNRLGLCRMRRAGRRLPVAWSLSLIPPTGFGSHSRAAPARGTWMVTWGPAAGPSGTVAECRRVGRKWRLAWQDRNVLIEDSIGMAHLAVLLANPRQEIAAADLVAGLAALSGAGDRGAAHPVLDQAAMAGYRHRLKRLAADRAHRRSLLLLARLRSAWRNPVKGSRRRSRPVGGPRRRAGRLPGPGPGGRRRPQAARRSPGPGRGGRPRPAAG